MRSIVAEIRHLHRDDDGASLGSRKAPAPDAQRHSDTCLPELRAQRVDLFQIGRDVGRNELTVMLRGVEILYAVNK